MKLEESNIIEKIKAGNDAVWSKVYANNYRMAESYILKNNGNKEQAKDTYQDAMMVLYRNIQREDFELTSKLSTYVFSIVQNLWLKQLRQQKRVTIIEEKLNDLPQTLAPNKTELEQQIQLVMQKVEQIGNPCASLLKAYYFLKKSMKEIALEMNYSSDKTAKAQKYKCVQRLKSQIDFEKVRL